MCAVMEHIFNHSKMRLQICTRDICHSYESTGRPSHELYDYRFSTTSVTLLAPYVQNTSSLLLLQHCQRELGCVYSTLLCYRISHDRRYIDRMMTMTVTTY